MKDAPSETAMLVAESVAFHSTNPRFRHLVDDEAGRLVRSFAPSRSRLAMAIRERLGVPGLSLHHVLRKRRIEQLVRDAIADGFRKLVVLGGGFDTLAIRLSGEIESIEIDHPATQQRKRAVLPDSAVTFIPADLTTNVTLPRGRAIFLAEAVFLYLTEAEIRAVLRQIDGRLIFTFWEPRDPINFQNATWLADWWLRHHGEPGQWAIAPERVGGFLATEGLTLVRVERDVDYHGSYRAARGEHIAVAETR